MKATYRNCPEICMNEKEFDMTTAPRTQLTAIFAAIVCAFITIGFSVAPAVAPVASYLA